MALVKSGFYDGQRVHRAVPNFLVQFGDPQSKDLSKRELWGRGAAAASGKPIGVAEVTTKRKHDLGAVGMAHMGDPAKADSQIYVTLAPRHDLDLAIRRVRPGGSMCRRSCKSATAAGVQVRRHVHDRSG